MVGPGGPGGPGSPGGPAGPCTLSPRSPCNEQHKNDRYPADSVKTCPNMDGDWTRTQFFWLVEKRVGLEQKKDET